jgi:hypothetical protein
MTMIRNPKKAGRDGTSRSNENAPPVNKDIALYFENRRRKRKMLATTHTTSGQTLDWVPVKSQI